MSASRFDVIYRRLIFSKFYSRGWGNPEDLKEILKLRKILTNRSACSQIISPDYDVIIDREIAISNNARLLQGHFQSPLLHLAPHLLPTQSHIAYFEMIAPCDVTNATTSSACIHMAGTGDHGFHRRREMIAKPLLRHNIASLLLENPFYGRRKPSNQKRSSLHYVTDLFVMGSCLILEGLVLLYWLKKNGYGPLGLTGVSMGGHMASLAATNWSEPLVVVPCMSWTSASVVWTNGVMSSSLPWKLLQKQLVDDVRYDEMLTEAEHDDGVMTSSSRCVNAVTYMRRLMDHMTHLRHYETPIDGRMATFVLATNDAYYPVGDLEPMTDLWPGCQIRHIDAGHVIGFLLHHRTFIDEIISTFQRILRDQHPEDQHPEDQHPGVDLQRHHSSLLRNRFDHFFKSNFFKS